MQDSWREGWEGGREGGREGGGGEVGGREVGGGGEEKEGRREGGGVFASIMEPFPIGKCFTLLQHSNDVRPDRGEGFSD